MKSKREQAVIGIDVSKNKLDIYNSVAKKHIMIKNDLRSIGQFLKKLNVQTKEYIFVLEPTGGYEKKLIHLLLKNECEAYYVHPNKLKHYKDCLGEKAKTDKIDARFISEYARSFKSHLTQIRATYIEEKRLEELNRLREQLKKELHAIQCQLKMDRYNSDITKINKRREKYVLKELGVVEKLIDDLIVENETINEKVELLKTITSVGRVVAQTFVIEVPELGTLNRTKIAKLIGVAPFNQDSGKKQGKRTIAGGRATVRKKLYMAALSAITHNLVMKNVYQKLTAKGKAPKVAIVAVMRRLLCIMNAMVRDNKPWQVTELTVQIP